MKALYDTEHNCKSGKYPCFPTENPFFAGNTADRPEAGYPGVPVTFPWYYIFPRSSNALVEALPDMPDITVEKTEITGGRRFHNNGVIAYVM